MNINLSLFALATCIGFVSCKKAVTDVKTAPIQYGIKDQQLPLDWAVAGSTDVSCKTNVLRVPENIVDDLNVAWSQANKLLGIPIEALAGQSDGQFMLNKVSLVLGTERVLVLNGCIGSKGESASATGTESNYSANAMQSSSGGMNTECQDLSPVLRDLKSPDKMKTIAQCGSPNLVAGFAMRSSARDIKLTAHFTIKGSPRSLAMEPFEVNTIEIRGDASASISSFGAAILPLPPPIKLAATAVLERVGTGSFAAMIGTVNTVLPDNRFRRVPDPSGSGTMHASRLAEKIASGILQPICREYHGKFGGFDVNKCLSRTVTGEFGSAEALERYRRMPVVNCESIDTAQKYLYALARKPDPTTKEADFLVHTGANPSKLNVYHKENGPVGSYRYKSWGTYIGPAKDPKKCGAFDSADLRCIVLVSGGLADGMGQCGTGVNRILSLVSAPTIDFN